MQYGLIGEHLSHSYSAQIHACLADYRYELCELAPGEVPAFLQKRNFRAINVTIPYKETVLPYLDEISEQARRIGAVNTVVNRNGRLFGYNTDYAGMTALLHHVGIRVKGKSVLILGSGGTSRTAMTVLADLGAAKLQRVSHSGQTDCLTYAQALLQTDTQILVNTTPVGMFPHVEETPLSLSAFPNLTGVIDAIYHPLQTNLVLDARDSGLAAEGGLYMLAAQAVYASALFLGREAEAERMETAYRQVLMQKRNVVLIGMPSSGKSAVGSLLAKRTGKTLLDTDKMVAEAAGCSIPELFARIGESGFRKLEKEAVRRAALQDGCIIATGGGVVLDAENVRRLKQNGCLFFLNRALENLAATQDRPLSSNRADLEKLYHTRLLLYRQAADVIVDADQPLSSVIEAILKESSK